jgi:hypothetical protein
MIAGVNRQKSAYSSLQLEKNGRPFFQSDFFEDHGVQRITIKDISMAR